MCWDKIFKKPPPPEEQPPFIIDSSCPLKLALLFAINNYPGGENDLQGCINDQINVTEALTTRFVGFQIRKFKDAEVTRSRFINEVSQAIKLLKSGDTLLIHYSGHGTQVYDRNGDELDGYDEALYLYDGMVIDDDLREVLLLIPEGAKVILMLDCCFSGSATRASFKGRKRYYKNPDLPTERMIKRVRFTPEEMKWLVLSGSEEYQTSADANINGMNVGAFTYYAMKTLKPGDTYEQWYKKIRLYLPNNYFDQIPTLEGDKNLFTKIVFN